MSDSDLNAPDLPLLEGEDPDLRVEARKYVQPAWLVTPNFYLGGVSPDSLIRANQGARVRELVRRIAQQRKRPHENTT